MGKISYICETTAIRNVNLKNREMKIRTQLLLIICFSGCIISCNSPSAHKKVIIEKVNSDKRLKSVYITNGHDTIKTDFDKNNRLIKKQTKGKLLDNYVYDEEGRLFSYNELNKWTGHTTYHELIYNEKGFLISDGDDPYIYTEYKNDCNGNCTVETRHFPQIIIKRKYNDKNQLIEQWMHAFIHSTMVNPDTGERYEEDDPFESEHILYTYNEFGDIILRKTTHTDKPQTDSISYKYDKKGNWTEQHHTAFFTDYGAEYDLSGECITRIVKYYK